MAEVKEIQLNLALGTAVRRYLDKKFKNGGAPARVPNAYNYNQSFTQEELSAVTDLTITGGVNPDELKNFPNLRNLSISFARDEYNNDQIEMIAKTFPHLQTLSLRGVSGFSRIDVSLFGEDFYGLELVSCPDLKKVDGVSSLLTNLVCVDNNSLTNGREIANLAVDNIDDIIDYRLDVTLAPYVFETLSRRGVISENDENLLKNCLSFGEIVSGSRGSLKHSFGQIKRIHEIAKEISQKVVGDEKDLDKKFARLYVWLCDNVTYDHEVVEREKKSEEEGKPNYDRRHKICQVMVDDKDIALVGAYKGTNSCLNAFLEGSCVCEGYSRALQYLCVLNGIKTSIVSCHSDGQGESKDPNVLNHSIIQIEKDGKALFCDPTWDRKAVRIGDEYQYFLLTEEQMTKRNHLSMRSNKPLPSAEEVSDQTRQSLLSRTGGKG